MILLCVTLCLLVIQQTYSNHKWHPLALGLLLLSSILLVKMIVTENTIFAVEILMIVLLCLTITMRNKILSTIIAIKYLTYHFILFIVINFILYVSNIQLTTHYELYVLGFISLRFLDGRYELTERLYQPIQTSMELMVAFFALSTSIIIYELRDTDIFTSTNFTLNAFIILSMFVILLLKVVTLTNYNEKKEDITQLKHQFAPEYNRLMSEHQNALETLSRTTIDYTLRTKLNLYFEEHQLPFYSDNLEWNFILYYALNTNLNSSYVDSECIKGYNIDLLLYYMVTLLLNFDKTFTLSSSHLEKNTLLISLSRKEVSTQTLNTFFKHFKVKDVPMENSWHLDALKYLFGINKITHQMLVSDQLIIKLKFGGQS